MGKRTRKKKKKLKSSLSIFRYNSRGSCTMGGSMDHCHFCVSVHSIVTKAHQYLGPSIFVRSKGSQGSIPPWSEAGAMPKCPSLYQAQMSLPPPFSCPSIADITKEYKSPGSGSLITLSFFVRSPFESHTRQFSSSSLLIVFIYIYTYSPPYWACLKNDNSQIIKQF